MCVVYHLTLTCCMLCLQILDLSNTNMGAAGMAQLVSANMPILHCLMLSNNQLDAAAIEQLVNHSWRLNCLQLDANNLDDAAMAYLARANGYQLEFVSLHRNQITSHGLLLLTQAAWPRLLNLCVDEVTLTSVTCAALSLTKKSKWGWYTGRPYLQAARLKEPRSSETLWLFLDKVEVLPKGTYMIPHEGRLVTMRTVLWSVHRFVCTACIQVT